MRGRDKILGDRTRHVVPNFAVLICKDRVVRREEECSESLQSHLIGNWNIQDVIAGEEICRNAATCTRV